MPAETCYVDEGKGAHKFCRGIVTSAEILAMARQQAADVEATRKLKYFLYDMTEVTDLQISAETITRMVEVNRMTADHSCGALGAIVAPNPLAYGMSRMWQSSAGGIGWKVQVFHTRAEAIAWLRTELADGHEDYPIDEEYPSLRLA